jgi:hypothetical protein
VDTTGGKQHEPVEMGLVDEGASMSMIFAPKEVLGGLLDVYICGFARHECE